MMGEMPEYDSRSVTPGTPYAQVACPNTYRPIIHDVAVTRPKTDAMQKNAILDEKVFTGTSTDSGKRPLDLSAFPNLRSDAVSCW